MFKSKKKAAEKAVVEEKIDAEEVVVEEVVVEEVIAEVPGDSTGAQYNGSEVVEKLADVNGDGRLCRLADGTTAYVPLHLLGEQADA